VNFGSEPFVHTQISKALPPMSTTNSHTLPFFTIKHSPSSQVQAVNYLGIMGRCRCSFCNIRVSPVARTCGIEDECTTQSMFLTVARFPFLTHTCILTSNNVIKFVLFLFCALSSLSSCCCLESTNAPAPATYTGPPPLPIPLSDLPAGLNATLINGFWYYYETKEGKVSSALTFRFLFFCFLFGLALSFRKETL
jgi:hypothetical protein